MLQKLYRNYALLWSSTLVDTPTSACARPPPDASTQVTTTWHFDNGTSSSAVESRSCIVCYEQEGNHVLLQCGHGGYCFTCVRALFGHRAQSHHCPMCRSEVAAEAQICTKTAVGEASHVENALVSACVVRDSVN